MIKIKIAPIVKKYISITRMFMTIVTAVVQFVVSEVISRLVA